MYTIKLQFSESVTKTQGKTVLEALEKLQPKVIKGKGILTVSKGLNLKKDMILYPQMAKRLLVNKVYREILDKRFTQALG